MDPNAPVQSYPPGQTPPPAPSGYGQPGGWQTPAPTSSGRGGFLGGLMSRGPSRLIGIVVVAVIIVGGYFVYQKVFNPDHRGQVIFTTSSQTGNDNCAITDRVDTIKSGDSVFIMVMWSHTMANNEKVVEEDFKDGAPQGTTNWDPSSYAGYDCSTASHDFKDTFSVPGKYEIKLTVGNNVVADGTLTVSP